MPPFLVAGLLCLGLLCLGMVTACGKVPAPQGNGQQDEPATAASESTQASPRQLAGAAEGWNVLLLSIDTLRADRLGAYGYAAYPEHPTSPHLDRLIGDGVRFSNAMAPRTITWPSLATVLTGLYPSAHGVFENGYEFPDDVPTLPKNLHAAGYRTGAFLGNMCRANHQGWDTFFCKAGQDGKVVQEALDWTDSWLAAGASNGTGAETGEQPPFFAWVHLFGAHSPYYNGGDLAQTTLNPGYEGDLVAKKWSLDAVMEQRQDLDEADLRQLNALYDAAVMGSDRIAGRLLDGLRERGLLDKTLVVFLADHGEDLYQHNGYLYHACSVYQSSLHVPLSFSAPGLLPAGAEVEQLVELNDVAPTIYHLLGLDLDDPHHGVALTPYLQRPDARSAGRPAFSEYGDNRVHTVRQGPWSLVHNPDGHKPLCFAGAPDDLYPIEEVELYDLSRDPLEQLNIADEHQAEVARLQELIRNRFNGLQRRDVEQELPEDLKKELRALGYVAN